MRTGIGVCCVFSSKRVLIFSFSKKIPKPLVEVMTSDDWGRDKFP